MLRVWATDRPPRGAVPWDDPEAAVPVRVRAGAVVLRDGRMLLIGCDDGDGGTYYEIPGGGVEEGETPREAAVREPREETGLSGGVVRELARVRKDGRREHCFLMDAEGDIGAAEELGTHGGRPVRVPVGRPPVTPLWPRRLSWRIAHRHGTGWPAGPAELADGIEDLRADRTW